MVCVSGSGQPAPYAMIVLSETARADAKNQSKRNSMGQELDAYRKEINGQLDHHEQLKMLVVISEEWTIENGKLTPTMKLKRPAIEDDCASHVQGWYDAKKSIVWH